jgi:hypothetical protein
MAIKDPKYSAPSTLALRSKWERIKRLEAETLLAEQEKERGEAEYLEAERRHLHGSLSRAATEFLKAHGYNGGGRTTRKIPGL